MKSSTGLVLEGGGMRGLYTIGVLEFFLEKDLFFPYTIGVSAGACNAASYLSRQKGRNERVTIGYCDNPRYISYKNAILKGELFGMDFIFNEIPTKHEPFDFETFFNCSERFVIGTTDCHTGESVYFEKSELTNNELMMALRASSSLPFAAPIVEFKGRRLLDGGISDPIPIKKSESEGFMKNVVILTRNPGYRKKKSRMTWISSIGYRKYKGINEVLTKRYEHYNESLDYLEEQQLKEKAFIIQPTVNLKVGRVERDPKKLQKLYNQGYKDAKQSYDQLVKFLE